MRRVPDVPKGVGTLRAVLTVLTIATCAAATAPSEDPKSIPEALPARTQPSEMFMIHQQDPFDQVAMETFEHRVYLNPASNFSSLVENGPVLVNGGVYEATQTGGLYEATQTDVENINIIYAKPQNSITLTTLQSTSLLPLSEIDTLTPLDKGDTFTISYNETLTIPGDNETHSVLDITEATTPISDDMHVVPEIKQLTTPTQDIAFIPVNGNSDAHTSTNNIILTTLKDSNTNMSPNITTTVTKLQLRQTGTTQATDEYTDLSNNTFLSLSNNTWEKQGFTDGVSTNTLDLLAQPSKQLVLQYLPCNSTHQAALSTNLEVAQGDNSVTSVNSTKTSVPTDSLLISSVVQSATNSSTLQNETSTQESLHGKRQVSPQPKQFFGPYSPQIPPYLESYYSHLHSDQPFLLPENIFGPPKRPEPFALRQNRPRPHSRKRLPPKRRRVRPHKQEVEDSVHSVISPETGGIDDPHEEFESDESLDYTIDPPQEYGLKLTPDKQHSKDTGNNTQPLNNFDEKVKIKYNSPEEVQQRFPPPGKQSSQSPILPAILASTTPANPNDRSIFSSSFPTTVYPPVISTISSEKIPTQNDQENILKGDNFRHQVYIPQGNVLVEKETNIGTTSEVQVTNLKDNGHESSLDDYTEGSTDNNHSLNAHSVYDSIGNPSPIEDNYSSYEHIDEISQFGENEQDALGSPLEENPQEKRSPLLNINTDLYEGLRLPYYSILDKNSQVKNNTVNTLNITKALDQNVFSLDLVNTKLKNIAGEANIAVNDSTKDSTRPVIDHEVLDSSQNKSNKTAILFTNSQNVDKNNNTASHLGSIPPQILPLLMQIQNLPPDEQFPNYYDPALFEYLDTIYRAQAQGLLPPYYDYDYDFDYLSEQIGRPVTPGLQPQISTLQSTLSHKFPQNHNGISANVPQGENGIPFTFLHGQGTTPGISSEVQSVLPLTTPEQFGSLFNLPQGQNTWPSNFPQPHNNNPQLTPQKPNSSLPFLPQNQNKNSNFPPGQSGLPLSQEELNQFPSPFPYGQTGIPENFQHIQTITPPSFPLGPNGSPKDSVEYSTGIPSIPQNINKIPNIPSLPQGNYPLSILQELAGLSALSQGQQIVPVTSVKPVTSPSITFLPSFSPPSSTLSNFPTTPRIRFQEDATTLNVGPQPVTWQTSNEYRSTNKPVQLFAALSSHNNDPNIQQQGFHTTHCKENKETTDSSELGNTNAQQNIKREVDISFPRVSREHGAPLVLVGKEQDPALLLVDKNRGIPVSNTQNQDIRQGNTIVPNSTNKLPSIQRDTISTTNSFSPETASVDPTSLLKPSVASSPSKEERISLNKNNESTITHDQPVDDTLTNPDNLHVTPLDGFKIDTNKEVTQIETPLLEQQNSRELNNDRIQNFVTVSPEILPSFQTESLIKDIIATTYTPLHEPEALRKLKSLFGFPNSKAQSTSKSTTTNLPDLNLALGSGLVVDDQILQNIQMLLQTDNPPSGVVLSPKDLFKNLEEVIKNSKGSSHSLLKEQANERGSSNTNSTIQPTERAKINLNAMKRLTAIKMSDESDIPAIIRNFIAAQKPPRSSSTPIDVNLQNSTQSPVQKVKMPDLITSLQAMMSEANKSSTGESIISESGLPTMKTNRENNDRTNTNNSDEGEFIILISDESTIYPKDGEFIVIIPHSPSTSYLSEIFPQKPNGRSVRQGDLKDYFIDVDAIENSDDSYISSSNKLYSTARQGIPNTQHANFSDVLQENESNDPSPLQDSEYNGISFRKSTPVLPSENGTFPESSIRNWFEPHTGGLGMTNLDQNEHGKQRDLNITGATWINTPDLHTILNQINDTFTSNNKPPLRSPQQFGYFYEGQYPQYWYGSPVGAIEYPDLLTPALDKRHGPNYNTLQLITAERAELLEKISSDDQTTNLSNTGTGNYEIFAPQTETDFNANITGQLNEHPELAEAINSDDTIVDYDFAEYHDGKTQASGDRVSDYHFPGSNSDIPLGLPGKDFHYDSSLVSLALDNINISTTNLSKAKWDGKLGNTNTSNHSTTDGRKNTISVPPEGERPQREVSLDGSLPFDDRLESGLKVTGNATTVNLGSTTLSDDSNITTFQGIPLDVLEYIRKGVLERIPETNTEQFIEKGTHFQPKAESSDVDNREQLIENTKIFPQSLESQISGKLNENANSSSSKTRQAITDNRGKNDSVFGTLSISSNFTANQKSIPSNTEKSDSGQTVTAKEKSGLRNNYFIPDTIVTILPTIALGTNRIPNGTRQFATNTTSNVTKSNTPKNISVPTPLSNAGLKVQETNTNDNSTLSPGLSNDDLSHDARENTHSEVLSNQSSDSGVLTQNKKTTASESRSLQSTTLSTIELKVINVTTNPVTSVNNNPSLGIVLNGFENVGNVSPDSLTNRFHPNVTFTDKIPVSTPSTDLQDTSRDNIFKSHKNETESENRNNSKSKDDDSVDGRIVDIDFGIVPRDTLSIANNAENFPFGDGSFDNTNEGIKQSNFAQENNSANGTTINTNTFSLHNQLGANRKSNLGQMVNTNKNSSHITDNTRDVRVNIKHTVQQPQKLNDPLQDINVDNARTSNITQDSQSARENIAGSIQSNSTSNQMIAEGENPSFNNISNINFGHIPEITNLSGLTIDFQLPGIQVVDITPIAQPKPNSQVDSSKSSNRVLKTPLINIPNSVVKPQDSFKNNIPILEEFNGGIQSDLSNTRLTTRSPTGSNTGGVTNADRNEGFTTGVNNLLPVNTQTLQDSTRVNNLLQVNKQTLQDSTRVNNLLQVNTQTLQDSTRVNNLLQVNTQTLQDSTRGLLPNVANYANYFIPSSVANSNDATTESPLRKGIPGQTDPVDGSKLTREINEVLLANAEPLELDGIVFEKVDASTLQKPGSSINDGGPFPEISHTGAHTFDSNEPIILLDSPVKLVSIEEQSKIVLPVAPHVVTSSTVLGDNDDLYSDYVDAQENLDFDYSVTEQQPNNSNQGNSDSFGKLNIPGSVNHNQGKPAGTPTLPPIIVGSPLGTGKPLPPSSFSPTPTIGKIVETTTTTVFLPIPVSPVPKTPTVALQIPQKLSPHLAANLFRPQDTKANLGGSQTQDQIDKWVWRGVNGLPLRNLPVRRHKSISGGSLSTGQNQHSTPYKQTGQSVNRQIPRPGNQEPTERWIWEDVNRRGLAPELISSNPDDIEAWFKDNYLLTPNVVSYLYKKLDALTEDLDAATKITTPAILGRTITRQPRYWPNNYKQTDIGTSAGTGLTNGFYQIPLYSHNS